MNKAPSPVDRATIEAVIGKAPTGIGRFLNARNLVLLLLALATFAGGYAWLWQSQTTQRGSFVYVTQPAAIASITVKVTATGTVQPTNQVDVSSELSGTVREVRVDYNSTVKTGDVLAVLDQAKLIAAVDNSRAHLNSSQAALQDADVTLDERQTTWERKKKLSSTSSGSAQDLDTAKSAYDRAVVAVAVMKANILAAQAQLKLDETNLARSQILSPIDGVVLMRKVDPGQTVASSLQAPILFTIAEDLRRMEIQVDVDEADVGGVKEGQSATFLVDAYPSRRFDARIRMVRFGSEVVQGVVTYKAVLTSDNSELLLRPGMTATAEILTDEAPNVLTVPNQALRFQPPQQEPESAARPLLNRILPGRPQFRPASAPVSRPGPNRLVHVLRNGEAVPVQVTVGASDERRTQIIQGDLKPGDLVIIEATRAR